MPIVYEAVGATILPNIGGFANSYFMKDSLNTWYKNLKKPSYNPPNWIFGPVWTSLYCGMGYASYLVYKDGGGFQGDAALPLALYGGQLALNWAWTPIFFGCRSTKWGLRAIMVLWGAAASSAYAMSKINSTAGLIMLPYMAWLSFASLLTFKLWQLNPEDEQKFK